MKRAADPRGALTAPLRTLAFGAAFGYFEAACVVYLKRLERLGEIGIGDDPAQNALVAIEIGREASSLALLALWALAAGRSRGERLGHFALAFGLWDVFYYVFLRHTIGWPRSLGEWDVLFLIPAPWYGPVATPVLVSLLLIVGGWGVVRGERLGAGLRLTAFDAGAIAAGCALMLAAFLWNAEVRIPFPERFPWWLFSPGWLLAAAGTIGVLRRLGGRARSQ